MAVCRIEKTKDYTVMANHHLRNKKLSLKAKGLLSLMLSLPEDWDYTVKGLAFICKDGIDSINGTIKELEAFGYINRRRLRNDKGQLTDVEYTIREYPNEEPSEEININSEKPNREKPIHDIPISENPILDKPILEKPHQSNTNISNKDILKTNSIPFRENENTSSQTTTVCKEERKGKEENHAYKVYEDLIKENIEYDHLLQNKIIPKETLNEIFDIILETVCTARKTIRIAGDDIPAEVVKAKFLKLDSSHIEFVVDCMEKNTTKVRNIKQYLKAVLFNAPSTIDSYFTALVKHDLYG